MPVGEGQRVFVMHRPAVGGKEGGGNRRRRRRMGSRPLQDIRSLHWPLPPHLVLILHFTAGEDPDNRDAMRNTLLSMLATLMCTLAASIDVTPMSGFDLEKVREKPYAARNLGKHREKSTD